MNLLRPLDTPGALSSPVIDGHCHVASSAFIPKSFIEGVVRNLAVRVRASGHVGSERRLVALYRARLEDHDGDQLVAQMNDAGVCKALLLLPDFTYALRDCELTIEEMIAKHARLMDRHPGRFVSLCGVDPRWTQDGLALFERAVTTLGFSGLKVYPPCGVGPQSRAFYPYYEICRARRIPVVVHTGPTSPALSFDMARPLLVDEPARAFPDVTFILAHGAVNHQDEALTMCAYRPNVYLDLGGFPALLCEGGPDAGMRRLFSLGINHKIIFGTDWPVFSLQTRYSQLVERATRHDGPMNNLSLAHRRRVLGQNLWLVLGMVPGVMDGNPRGRDARNP